MGSANLNDRSQKGDGDSEIALVVEDTEEIASEMDGRRVRLSLSLSASHCILRWRNDTDGQLLIYYFSSMQRLDSQRASAASFTEVCIFPISIPPVAKGKTQTDAKNVTSAEHLGLIVPQNVTSDRDPVDSFMRAAPFPNADETQLSVDALVADPLSDGVLELWQGTAKRNREIFTEVFRPVPTDLVQNWTQYKVRAFELLWSFFFFLLVWFCALFTNDCVGFIVDTQNYLPKVKTGHVAPEISLDRAKKQLSQVRARLEQYSLWTAHVHPSCVSQVRGQLVEMPLQFLIEEKELVDV